MNTNLTYSGVPLVVATLGLLLCSSNSGAVADGSKPTTHTVMMEATSFQPALLIVKAGDSVVWVNKDPFPHTVTSDGGEFDSHIIAPDKSWAYTPKTKGDFAYTCTLHQTMKAMLRVQ